MTSMISYCGIDCVACRCYLATQANDEAAKERIAADLRRQYNTSTIDAAFVTCDGCRNLEGRPGGHCGDCDVRTCGMEHKVINCAYCAQYDGCEKLARFFGTEPESRPTLEEIRRSL